MAEQRQERGRDARDLSISKGLLTMWGQKLSQDGRQAFPWTAEGWLYLVAVTDLFSRRIVGWAMDARITRSLVEVAHRMALRRRRQAVRSWVRALIS